MEEYDGTGALLGIHNILNPSLLEEAYAIAEGAREAQFGLEYWSIEAHRSPVAACMNLKSIVECPRSNPPDYEDLNVRKAIDLSLQGFHKVRKRTVSTLPTPSQSPPLSSQKRSRTTVADLGSPDLELRSPPPITNRPLKSRRGTHQRMPAFIDLTQYSDDEDYDLGIKREDSPLACDQDTPSNRKLGLKRKRTSSPSPSYADDSTQMQLDPVSPTEATAADGDDLEMSKDWVTFRVGREGEVYSFPKSYVWDRPYWRNLGAAIMRFTITDDNRLELQHPALSDIDPVDFHYVGQFLESGDFGIQHANTAEEVQDTFAAIAAAWDAAEKLNMTDLMQCCVRKIQRLASLDLDACLVFARIVYDCDGEDDKPRKAMKDFLCFQLADRLHEVLANDALRTRLLVEWRRQPEMEQDMLQKKIGILRGEPRGVQEGDDDDNDD